MTQPLCVVTGASGAVGPVVVNALAASGYRVRALSRSGGAVAGAESVAGDITVPAHVEAALDGADCVVHMAALLHVNNPPPAMKDEYRRVNVGGTENVVRAVAKCGVRRMVQMSTIAVYGYNRGTLITEELAPQPDTLYGQSKWEAEQVAAGANPCVLRLAAVYGQRVKGNYRRLLDALHRRRFVAIGRGSNRRTLVYDRDVAAAVVEAVQHASAPGRTFNLTDGSIHTVADIISAMAAALGVPGPRLTLPVAPIRAGAAIAERVARIAGLRSPVSPLMIDKYVEDVAVSGERIQRELGFVPQYSLQEGWRDAVARLRASGELRA